MIIVIALIACCKLYPGGSGNLKSEEWIRKKSFIEVKKRMLSKEELVELTEEHLRLFNWLIY